jgi:hypothetical protein
MDNINLDFYPELFFASNLVVPLRSTKGIKRLSASERALIVLPDEVQETLVGILKYAFKERIFVFMLIALSFLLYINSSIQENLE